MNKRFNAAGAFILGAAIMALVGYTVFDWPLVRSRVKSLKTEVTSEYVGSLKIGQAEAKLRPLDKNQTAVAVRFPIENMHPSPVAVQATITLYDDDGFELGQKTVDSTSGPGDFKISEVRTIFIELEMPVAKAFALSRAKILGRSLQTASQMEEQRKALLQEDANRRDALAKAERKKIEEMLAKERQKKAAIAARWAQLNKGMAKREVEILLGRPLNVRSNVLGEVWEYDYSENYIPSKVEFDRQGLLESWNYR